MVEVVLLFQSQPHPLYVLLALVLTAHLTLFMAPSSLHVGDSIKLWPVVATANDDSIHQLGLL